MIEQPVQIELGRLSESSLWERQQEFFLREGAGIWTRSLVPRYITTNPFIASTYAEVVAAYLEDCCEANLETGVAHIVEFGAGSGEFSFHFLHHFAKLQEEQPGGPRFRYVMTDISESTIEYWRTHAQLKPFVEASILDFARFDVCSDRELRLINSGRRLGRGTVGPLVFIANYVFDCLPQDSFAVCDGQLYECLTDVDAESLLQQVSNEPPQNEPVELSYQQRRCSSEFYGREDWDAVLRGYGPTLRNGAFMFPVGTLKCLETLEEISRGQFMLLTADKGFLRIEALAANRRSSLVKHGGCFSLDVNFHALAAYARRKGARVLQRANDASHLNILSFVYGSDRAPRTTRAYERYLADFSADDFYSMMSDVTRNVRSMSLEGIASLLRLSRFDPTVLVNCYERLVQILPAARESERRAFYDLMQRVEGTWFVTDPQQNPDFYLGTLAGAMGMDHEAITYYRRAQAKCDSAGAEHNLGLSCLMLSDLATAVQCFARACDLDDKLAEASLLLEKMKFWPPEASLNAAETRVSQLENAVTITECLHHPDIVLEPLLPLYAEAFYEQATPEILGLTRLPAFQSVAEVRQWIRALTSDARNYSFAITHSVHGLVGVVSLLKVSDKAARFFFWIGSSFTSRGYATTATCRLLRFALDRLSLDELFTCVLPHNERSASILRRLGFRRVDMPDDKLHYYRNGVERFTGGEAAEHMKQLLGGDARKIIVKHLKLD